jgi:hypothetical protein
MLTKPSEQPSEIAWAKHNRTRRVKTFGAVSSELAMQTPQPLEQHVCRTEVSDNQVRINIERLLKRLCTDDDQATFGATLLMAEDAIDSLVEQRSIFASEPPVMQRRHTFASE